SPARVTGINAGEAIANVELRAGEVRLVASITVEAVRQLGLAEAPRSPRSSRPRTSSSPSGDHRGRGPRSGRLPGQQLPVLAGRRREEGGARRPPRSPPPGRDPGWPGRRWRTRPGPALVQPIQARQALRAPKRPREPTLCPPLVWLAPI